ncbi:alpha/beta hydrolase fold domain-containing protein [Rhodococcus sp. 2H158]
MTTVTRRSRVLASGTDTLLRPVFEHLAPSGPGRMLLRGVVAAGSAIGGLRAAPGTRVFRDTVPGEMIVPDHARDDAAILYLHGGGYVAGSARLERAVTSDLAAATRHRVLVPDYRRAPEHRFPAARTDALAAYRSLIARGYPPARTALVGVSAGAHLAMSMLTTLIECDQPLPAAAVLFSPLLDPSCTDALRADALHRDPFLPPAFAQCCARSNLDTHDLSSPHVNVLQAPASVLAQMPPLVSYVGSTECFGSDSARLHQALLEAGATAAAITVPGQVHSFVSMCRRLPEARAALVDAAAFLQGHLRTEILEEEAA